MDRIRHFFTLIFLLLISLSLFAQVSQGPPDLQWQHCYGGTLDDVGYGITSTWDGYLIVGCAGSSDGDILKPADEEHGGTCDYWAVKLDLNGAEQHKLHMGGTGSDQAFAARVAPDGNYLIGGTTSSTDVDVTDNHSANQLDIWIVKTTPWLSVIWKKCYGSTGYDDFGSVINTSDGNMAFCGGAQSNDGDVSGNHGDMDFWLVKADQNGNILWQKCYGGTQYEKAFDLKQCIDGGYVLVGFTESNDGDVSGNHSADYDGWIIKTDANGNLQWQKCLGGSSQDGFTKIVQLSDQNFMVAGYESSNNSDINNNHGEDDAWLSLVSPEGNLLWSKAYGGDSIDGFYDIRQDELGKIEVAGYTKSFNDDVNFNHGDKDYWLLSVDEDGNILWDTVFGGPYDDVCYAMTGASDGGIVLNGYTTSNNCDVTGNHGAIISAYNASVCNTIDTLYYQCKKDYWITKLESVVGIQEIPRSELKVIPTLTNATIQVSLDEGDIDNALVTIRSSAGTIVRQQTVNHESKLLLDVSSFAQGIYFIEISNEKKSAVGKFVKW